METPKSNSNNAEHRRRHDSRTMKRWQQIQALKAEKDRLSYENAHDALTGLLTKQAWKDRINDWIAEGEPFLVVFKDLDGFKLINDTFGHEEADKLLGKYGPFLLSKFRRETDEISHEKLIGITEDPDKDTPIGRYGGDEVGMLIKLVNRDENEEHAVEELAERELAYVRNVNGEFVSMQPDEIRQLGFNVSIGYAVWTPESTMDTTELLNVADDEMRKDKRSHKAPER